MIDDCLFRREFLPTELYNEDLRVHENLDLLIRLRFEKKGKFGFLREPLVTCYNHRGSRASDNLMKFVEGTNYILNRYSELLRDYPDFVGRHHATVGTLLIRNLGQKRAACSHLWKGVKGNPSDYKTWAYLLISLLPFSIWGAPSVEREKGVVLN